MPALLQIGAENVLICDRSGPIIDGRLRAVDLIGEALGLGASMVAVPVARLGEAFFELRSGVAGEIAQIAVNYRVKLVILGDIAEHIARSNALRDWVLECHRGGDMCFVTSLEELKTRLA
jgi:hypothetical protein